MSSGDGAGAPLMDEKTVIAMMKKQKAQDAQLREESRDRSIDAHLSRRGGGGKHFSSPSAKYRSRSRGRDRDREKEKKGKSDQVRRKRSRTRVSSDRSRKR